MTHRPFTPISAAALSLALLFNFGCSKNELQPASAGAAASVQAALADGSTPSVVLHKNQYIIIASGDKLPADIESQTAAANGKMTALMEEVGLASATSDDPGFAAKLGRISGVRSVVRDFSYPGFDPKMTETVEADGISSPPTDGRNNRYFPLQWGLSAIHAPAAWQTGAQGAGAVVADLDTGFDLRHPDLAGQIIDSKSFVPAEPSAQFKGTGFSHGTHTAGIIAAADNSIGIIGVAPKAKLLLIKVLPDAGSGDFSWLLQGIVYAVSKHASVINMSLGASLPRNGKFLNDNGTPNNPADDFVENDTKAVQELVVAINKTTTYAAQHGVTVIASAGNDANNGNQDKSLMQIPAGSPNVVSISATAPIGWALNPTGTFLDNLASYSNYGTSDVDFAAPGGDFLYYYTDRNRISTIAGVTQRTYVFDFVYSLNSAGRYAWAAGTSMAAPHVSGVAALIIGKNGGQMDPARVIATLRASADDLGKPGRDPYYGHGRVNAYRAVAQAN